jgi:hypothetical protein
MIPQTKMVRKIKDKVERDEKRKKKDHRKQHTSSQIEAGFNYALDVRLQSRKKRLLHTKTAA